MSYRDALLGTLHSNQEVQNELEIQLRSEVTGLTYAKTFAEVAKILKKDFTIWKISFSTPNQRYRLLRKASIWENRPFSFLTKDGKTTVTDDLVPLEQNILDDLKRNGICSQ